MWLQQHGVQTPVLRVAIDNALGKQQWHVTMGYLHLADEVYDAFWSQKIKHIPGTTNTNTIALALLCIPGQHEHEQTVLVVNNECVFVHRECFPKAAQKLKMEDKMLNWSKQCSGSRDDCFGMDPALESCKVGRPQVNTHKPRVVHLQQYTKNLHIFSNPQRTQKEAANAIRFTKEWTNWRRMPKVGNKTAHGQRVVEEATALGGVNEELLGQLRI